MSEHERRLPLPPAHDEVAAWMARHADALAWLVPVLFVIFAALAVGIAFTSASAKHAVDLNERSAKRQTELVTQIDALRDQNRLLVAQVEALRRQVEALGAEPVEVTITDRRTPTTTPPSSTTTIAPPSTTTTTTQPCRVVVSGRCTVP